MLIVQIRKLEEQETVLLEWTQNFKISEMCQLWWGLVLMVSVCSKEKMLSDWCFHMHVGIRNYYDKTQSKEENFKPNTKLDNRSGQKYGEDGSDIARHIFTSIQRSKGLVSPGGVEATNAAFQPNSQEGTKRYDIIRVTFSQRH